MFLKNKVAFITGSSSGIGEQLALAFADHGADVIVHGNSKISEAEKLCQKISNKGVQSLLVKGDLTMRSEVESIFSKITEVFGRIDILINNAGTMVKRCKIEDLKFEDWNRIIDVNLTSVFHVTQAIIPLMKQQGGGTIINMSSVAARNGGGGGAVAYATAKGGVSTLTKGLAKELAQYNIRVNAIAPGVITTPFHDQYSTTEMREKMITQVPLGREGKPEEIAGAALYLASDYSSYVTGEIIEVTGGMV
jgi:3-oxoacyl-[acyl-carrier protein] reductase